MEHKFRLVFLELWKTKKRRLKEQRLSVKVKMSCGLGMAWVPQEYPKAPTCWVYLPAFLLDGAQDSLNSGLAFALLGSTTLFRRASFTSKWGLASVL